MNLIRPATSRNVLQRPATSKLILSNFKRRSFLKFGGIAALSSGINILSYGYYSGPGNGKCPLCGGTGGTLVTVGGATYNYCECPVTSTSGSGTPEDEDKYEYALRTTKDPTTSAMPMTVTSVSVGRHKFKKKRQDPWEMDVLGPNPSCIFETEPIIKGPKENETKNSFMISGCVSALNVEDPTSSTILFLDCDSELHDLPKPRTWVNSLLQASQMVETAQVKINRDGTITVSPLQLQRVPTETKYNNATDKTMAVALSSDCSGVVSDNEKTANITYYTFANCFYRGDKLVIMPSVTATVAGPEVGLTPSFEKTDYASPQLEIRATWEFERVRKIKGSQADWETF